MKGLWRYAFLLTIAICGPTPAWAAEIYVAFTGFSPFGGNSFGIAYYNAQTLQFDGSFLTDSLPTALGYANGMLYDVENGTVVLRNPTSGAIAEFIGAGDGPLVGLTTYNGTEYTGHNVLLNPHASVDSLLPSGNGPSYPIGEPSLSGLTSGNGVLYESTQNFLVLTLPGPLGGVSNTVGGSGGATLGAIIYNPDSNIVQAAVDLIVPGTSVEIKGVIDFRGSDGSPILSIFVPAGLDLGYVPSGLAFGLHSLYASNLGDIQRLDPTTGAVLGDTGPKSQVFGALLFVPEPSSIALAAIGLVSLLAVRRRNRPA